MADKKITFGIFAHVDSGKTTLSEALLFAAGEIRKKGRVDHGDAFLDTDSIEKQRGITIFSKQAVMNLPGLEITLLDTPGHADFSAEAERVMCVLDYAVLVISASDGVQSHTSDLWHLLARYNIPVFIFVNKMDQPGADRDAVLGALNDRLSDCCIDFTPGNADFFELAALADQGLLDEYMDTEKLSRESLAAAVRARKLFPVYFGSALKGDGTEELLRAMARYAVPSVYPAEFAARIFKITQDERGKRLTHLKILGGNLKVRDELCGSKVSEIRVYSGQKFKAVQELSAGSVCVVTGLERSFAGQGLGTLADEAPLSSEPVLSYGVILPQESDIISALSVFKKLEEEESSLHVRYSQEKKSISIQIMGEVQLEVLTQILKERHGLDCKFTQGDVIYQETIIDTVEGVGHYEPLRHYAEVHLLLEPGERGSGITVSSAVSTDVLDRNWQRLIITHVLEKKHLGVLTGAPVTDIKITLVNGRSHIKHTEGGDFRQATYRAIRQGLMQAESIVLEPWYSFSIILPTEMSGRVMTELQNLGAVSEVPMQSGEETVLKGTAPVAALRKYQPSFIAYTRGRGRMSLSNSGYHPCKNQEQVVKAAAYDPLSDTENSPHSVFCSHGSGELVSWDKVFEFMHLPLLKTSRPDVNRPERLSLFSGGGQASDEELMRIFENTYGKIRENQIRPFSDPFILRSREGKALSDHLKERTRNALSQKEEPAVLFVDGYNMIFAWPELKKLAEEGLRFARLRLIDRLSNYCAYTGFDTTLVFDAYKVKGAVEKCDTFGSLKVVYTKEGETADRYIEKGVAALKKGTKVMVASSDNLEQVSVMGHGAMRIPAGEFLGYLEQTEEEIRTYTE